MSEKLLELGDKVMSEDGLVFEVTRIGSFHGETEFHYTDARGTERIWVVPRYFLKKKLDDGVWKKVTDA